MKFPIMRTDQFLSLAYKDQLQLISHTGKLKNSFIENGYQFSLYKVKDFYVELKRNIHELSFEKITALDYSDLPAQYK